MDMTIQKSDKNPTKSGGIDEFHYSHATHREVLLLTIEELDGMYLQAQLFQWFVT